MNISQGPLPHKQQLGPKLFHRCAAAFIALLMTLCLSSVTTANEEEGKWKKVKDKDGVQVYRAHSEETRLKTFRTVTLLELEDVRAFIGLLVDGDSYPDWGHMITSSEITDTDSKLDYGVYMTTRLPWPVKNRHVKGDYRIHQSEDYSIRVDMTQALVPPPERKGYILSPEIFGYFALKTFPGSKQVEITSEVYVDPGGYVPAFMVNLITDDLSFYSTKKLRRYIQKDKYKNLDIDFIKRRPWVLDGSTLANTEPGS